VTTSIIASRPTLDVAVASAVTDADRPAAAEAHVFRTLIAALEDVGLLLVILLMLPLLILLLGMPIALIVRAVIEIARRFL